MSYEDYRELYLYAVRHGYDKMPHLLPSPDSSPSPLHQTPSTAIPQQTANRQRLPPQPPTRAEPPPWWKVAGYTWETLTAIPQVPWFRSQSNNEPPTTYAWPPEAQDVEGYGPDATSFVPEQAEFADWNLPLLFAFATTPCLPRSEYPPAPPPLLNPVTGRAVIGINGRELRDFTGILPRHISRFVSAARILYWKALNPHIKWNDIIDRFRWPMEDHLQDCPDKSMTVFTTYGFEAREKLNLDRAVNRWRNKYGIIAPKPTRNSRPSAAALRALRATLDEGDIDYVLRWPRDAATNTTQQPLRDGAPLGWSSAKFTVGDPLTREQWPDRVREAWDEHVRQSQSDTHSVVSSIGTPLPRRRRQRDWGDDDVPIIHRPRPKRVKTSPETVLALERRQAELDQEQAQEGLSPNDDDKPLDPAHIDAPKHLAFRGGKRKATDDASIIDEQVCKKLKEAILSPSPTAYTDTSIHPYPMVNQVMVNQLSDPSEIIGASQQQQQTGEDVYDYSFIHDDDNVKPDVEVEEHQVTNSTAGDDYMADDESFKLFGEDDLIDDI